MIDEKKLNVVFLDQGVRGHDRQVLDLSLGNQDPVEWIAVMKGQLT